MKIKTITCHDIYNYGAGLQAYALMTYLEDLGHEVEIIDYKPDYLSRRLSLTTAFPFYQDKPAYLRIPYIIAKIPSRLRQNADSCKRAFDEFNARYLRRTPKRYRDFRSLEANPPSADAYLAGSDQIWNTTYRNGKDPAFYLKFAPPGTLRISYAASISTREIVPEYKEFFTEAVRGFDSVSVREAMSVELLKSLGIEGAVHVLDPVFLLEREHWDGLADAVPDEKYLLIYDFEGRPSIEAFAKRIAAERGLKFLRSTTTSKRPMPTGIFTRKAPAPSLD